MINNKISSAVLYQTDGKIKLIRIEIKDLEIVLEIWNSWLKARTSMGVNKYLHSMTWNQLAVVVVMHQEC